jgi:L-glyceraldehyde 3-phosphate reductase
MERRKLGASDLEVSALALGSWRTYERIPREQGLAVMTAAREAGITFLDDARYNDETGTAPIATGYSEVVFGELFRAADWARDEVVVSNKLWWEFWPEQTAAEELDASLGRMRFDYVDLVYAERLPEALPVDEAVSAAAALINAGKARAWGVLNWPAEAIAKAAHSAAAAGLPGPCAAQLPYSLALPEVVEDSAMVDAFDSAGTSVVASFALAGGALSGKYSRGEPGGRLAGQLDAPRWQSALEVGERLLARAAELDTTPCRLALAFALANERVASVLFGATRSEQVADDVGALDLLEQLGEEGMAELRSLAPAN